MTAAEGRRQRQSGFTLLEILAALAMFAVVSAALYGSLSRTIAGRRLAEERMERLASARTALTWIENDLAGHFNTDPHSSEVKGFFAPPLRAPDDRGLIVDLTNANALATTAIEGLLPPLAADRGDQARVAYALESDPSDSGSMDLLRYEVRPPGPLDPGADAGSVIAKRVKFLELRFFDGRSWHYDWDSSGRPADGQVPLLVETRLALTSNDGSHFPVLTSALALAPLGQGP